MVATPDCSTVCERGHYKELDDCCVAEAFACSTLPHGLKTGAGTEILSSACVLAPTGAPACLLSRGAAGGGGSQRRCSEEEAACRRHEVLQVLSQEDNKAPDTSSVQVRRSFLRIAVLHQMFFVVAVSWPCMLLFSCQFLCR